MARSCADDHLLDQSVNFDELAIENLNECGEERATASLHRQMELFIERAAHGKLELHASSVLVLALQLVSQIPGFVVGSVVNLHETPSALKGDPTLAGHELAGNVRCRQGGYAVDGPMPRYLGNYVGNPVLCDPSHWVRRRGHLVRAHAWLLGLLRRGAGK